MGQGGVIKESKLAQWFGNKQKINNTISYTANCMSTNQVTLFFTVIRDILVLFLMDLMLIFTQEFILCYKSSTFPFSKRGLHLFTSNQSCSCNLFYWTTYKKVNLGQKRWLYWRKDIIIENFKITKFVHLCTLFIIRVRR